MLNGKQRSYLKKLAHDLPDAVVIGKNEMTDGILSEIDNYLTAHEIVKVKLLESALLDPKTVANEAAEKLRAEYVQAIGRKFILYRENPDEKYIILPR